MTATDTVRSTVTFEDVLAASERIAALARQTPVMSSRLFDQASGVQTFFKCENLQLGGSFKIRGAANFILQLSAEERKRGVVTFSSGNHAQGVAIAAAYAGVPATIVMPTDAPKAKVESTRAYDPRIIFFDRKRENREEIAAKIATETGAVTLPSYDHPWIVAGQATASLEFLKEHADLDALLAPLGGGGLMSGALIAARALRPKMQVFGVEPELANDWEQSLARGERVEIAPPETIADGLRTPTPGKITFEVVREFRGRTAVVSEGEIRAAVRFILSRMKLLVEPSGAVAAAALLHRKLPLEGAKVGVIFSGGNIDYDVLAAICQEAV